MIKKALRNVTILALSWVLAESVFYLFLCFGILRPDLTLIPSASWDATNRPYTKYDSLTGYRYLPVNARLLCVTNHKITVDHIVRVNKQGYCSVNDFNKKATNKTRRYVVFGDSYTAGEVTDTTWPDLVNKSIIPLVGSNQLELLNFGLEGIGLPTWHRQFFNEVVPNYDFDGVILAIFGNDGYNSFDLNRHFVIKHSKQDATWIGFFPQFPKLINGQDTLTHMIRSTPVFTDSQLDFYRKQSLGESHESWLGWLQVKPYLSFLIWNHLYRLSVFAHYYPLYFQYETKQMLLKKNGQTSMNQVYNYLGQEKYTMLLEILNYCRNHDKDIVISSIPAFDMLSTNPEWKKNNPYKSLLTAVAQDYNALYVDGYIPFDTVPTNRLMYYQLHGDSHWNRQGVELFSKHITNELASRNHEYLKKAE